MDFDCSGEIIATQRLRFFDVGNNPESRQCVRGQTSTVKWLIRLSMPTPDLSGLQARKPQLARGHDSIQASQSALMLISAGLNHLNNELGGKLIWDGAGKSESRFSLVLVRVLAAQTRTPDPLQTRAIVPVT